MFSIYGGPLVPRDQLFFYHGVPTYKVGNPTL